MSLSNYREDTTLAKAIRQLSALDAAFLYQETAEMPMHVGSLIVFQLPDDYQGDFYDSFKRSIGSRLHLAPILKWKLANAPYDLDHPSWVEDDQFDLDRHVFRAALSEPRTLATVERVAGWMHAKLLNRARPLWEFYVYEGVENRQVFVYFKIHHACIDGGAGAALLNIIYDATRNGGELPRAEPPAALPATGDQDVPDIGAQLMKSYLDMWQQPLKLMTQWPDMLKALSPVMNRLADPRAFENLRALTAPKTIFNGSVSSERSFAVVTVSLSRTKAVAAAAGGKVNDVVMAISSGTLRRYLSDKQALPREPLTAMIPISLREKGDTEANNQVMSMVTSLATDVSDPKERLATIIKESTRSKEMVHPFKQLMPFYTTGNVIGAPIAVQIMAVLYSRSNLSDVMAPMTNVVISNVAGPKTPLYAVGAEMLHMFPVSIASHGTNLNITCQGYLDELDFGLIAGANLIPNMRELADMLPQELEVLERAYGIIVNDAPVASPARSDAAPVA